MSTSPLSDAECQANPVNHYALIAALTERQRDVLGEIALDTFTNLYPKRIIKSLLDKGLIYECQNVIPGRFPVKLKMYQVTWAVHIAWCQWCADNVELPDAAGCGTY